MALDRRIHAYRSDLADISLKGQVEAERFVSGDPASIAIPVVDLRPKPDLTTGIDTQLLFGETVTVFERSNGWAWVKAAQDSYVGYLPESGLAEPNHAATHWIIQPRTFVYSESDMKRPVLFSLSIGSQISVTGEAETRGTRYLLLATGGAVVAQHAVPIAQYPSDDFVSVAARLLETPYLWGGKSAFGLDCSALVQLAMLMTGRSVPRDSDMQAKSLGVEIERGDLKRGDLVFWKGHVGIMEDDATLLHANGHTMSVARENLDAAIERIGWLYGGPTGYRRPSLSVPERLIDQKFQRLPILQPVDLGLRMFEKRF